MKRILRLALREATSLLLGFACLLVLVAVCLAVVAGTVWLLFWFN